MAANGTWLVRHGLDGHAVTPLVAARLGMRRRVARFSVGAFLVTAIGLTVVLDAGAGWEISTFLRTLQQSAAPSLVALMVANSWFGPLLLRRHDNRLAQTLTVRVTHPAPWGWLAVVGRARLVVTAISYGGSILIGLWALVNAAPSAQVTSAVAVGTMALLGASVAWEVQRVVTRPTLADDDFTLAVDDEVRVEDARTAVAPALPPLLTMWVLPHLVAQPIQSVLTQASFALLGVVAAVLLWLQGTKRPGRQLVASPTR